jgi:chitinase
LFSSSTGPCSGTSVKELIAKGIPANKIVVGKPATPQDVSNTGYVDSKTLGTWIAQASRELQWNTGVMLWQYSSDSQGLIINDLAQSLITLSKSNSVKNSQSDSKIKSPYNHSK